MIRSSRLFAHACFLRNNTNKLHSINTISIYAPIQSDSTDPKQALDSITLPNGDVINQPREPHPDECCGRGCAECVWTLYWDNLKSYNEAKSSLEGKERPLDPFELLEQRLASQHNTDNNNSNQ